MKINFTLFFIFFTNKQQMDDIVDELIVYRILTA